MASFNFGSPNSPQISGAKGMMNNGGGGNTGYMAQGKKKKKKREIEIDPKILEGEAEDKFIYQEDEYEDDDDYYGTASDGADSGDSFSETVDSCNNTDVKCSLNADGNEVSDVFLNSAGSKNSFDDTAKTPKNKSESASKGANTSKNTGNGTFFGFFDKISKQADKILPKAEQNIKNGVNISPEASDSVFLASKDKSFDNDFGLKGRAKFLNNRQRGPFSRNGDAKANDNKDNSVFGGDFFNPSNDK